MQLFSIPFLFYFLPLFLGVYYIVPDKNKVFVTIIGSVIFFLLQEGTTLWQLLLLLFFTVAVFAIGAELRKPEKGWLLWAALASMAALLVFFKCWGGGLLPLGMSFYLFQLTAYLLDVRWKRLEPEKSLTSFAGQILLFPKLLSGPLMVPRSLQAQMHHPRGNFHRFHDGLQDLILGLSMKVLLADRIAGLFQQAALVGFSGLSPLFAWTALLSFAMRLYFDFHGYSLMAVGLGRMLGFELPRNFEDPYAACSVSDFFRRWHITLGAWFREYVYIPLGGNRKGKWRTAGNILIVWTLTGLWHGIGGGYLIWGLFLGLLIASEKLWLGKYLHRMGVGARLYTLGAILLSWVPFAVGDRWGTYLTQLFGFGGGSFGTALILQYLPVLLPGLLFLTPYPGRLFDRYREKIWMDFLLFILFWVSVYFVAIAKQDPFLYFQF